jgi:pantetheine-phosphate adenylyltransferase
LRIAVYPGSFDPITNGHKDIAERAARLFDQLIVAVYEHPAKDVMFTAEERIELMRGALARIPNVQVDSFSGLAVEYARRRGAIALVRGLRAVSDFEFEFQMAHMNRNLNPDLEATYLMTTSAYAFLSSSIVKEVAMLGGSLDGMVCDTVAKALRQRAEARQRAGHPPTSNLVP